MHSRTLRDCYCCLLPKVLPDPALQAKHLNPASQTDWLLNPGDGNRLAALWTWAGLPSVEQSTQPPFLSAACSVLLAALQLSRRPPVSTWKHSMPVLSAHGFRA